MSQTEELYHYGVPGMKWGKRRSNYVTIRQANINAKRAGNKAIRESFANDKAKLKGIGSGRKALNNASVARKTAVKESLAKDKAHNKNLRAKNNNQNKSDSLKEYQQKTLTNYKIRYAGYGAKLTGVALKAIGKTTYNKFKDDGSPAAAAVVNGTMIASKILNNTGDVAITASFIKQFADWGNYMKS